MMVLHMVRNYRDHEETMPKVERLQFAFPSPLTVRRREASELDQAGSVRIQSEVDVPLALNQTKIPCAIHHDTSI